MNADEEQSGASRARWRIGVDIGGTFTDIVCLRDDGALLTRKVSSSTDDYARAITRALAAMIAETALEAARVGELRHGTTIASNAILEGKGARTGLIATEGFRDILEIRNLRMPRLYDMAWRKPPPLVPRYLRRTVAERMTHEGRVQTPLDPQEAEAAIRFLLAEGVEAIAVALLHSYANPEHEARIAETVERLAPGVETSISHRVLPEAKEYERTSTTVVNAYLKPVVSRYLGALERGLEETGLSAPLLLMQSSGGLMPAAAARRLPMHIVESGPAGGVIGAQALARLAGLDNILTFDMGGTTAKASIVERGAVTRALEFSVGGGVIAGSRLMTGAGYIVKTPAIDLAEVGAGGGSLLRLDPAGALQVGPESAGADPGPICYGAGGVEPTLTDANLLLGYLNPDHLVGGALRLDYAAAEAAFAEKIARPMGLSVEEAALGAHRIAASNMIRAIRAVSSERGRDPRDYALFAFGGNGPLFAAGMAKALGVARVLAPPSPGLFSSFGLLYAEVEHHYSRACRCILRDADPAELEAVWAGLEAEAEAQLAAGGVPAESRALSRSALLHYHGQIFELQVDAPPGPIDAAWIRALEEAFGVEHELSYGHRAGPEEPVELMTAQLVGRGLAPRRPEPQRPPPPAAAPRTRRAWFGREEGWREAAVLERGHLGPQPVPGPVIVEEYDATCLAPPGAAMRLDDYGNIVIEIV